MVIKINNQKIKKSSYILILILLSIMVGISIDTKYVIGANITNSTVIARVNVSNTEPIVYEVRITHPTVPIDLTPGNVTIVTCNGSVRDINGYDDIKNVSATLYYDGTAAGATDDNNTHYTNVSCGTCTVIEGSNNQNGSCLCNFAVQYFANPGDWRCNMTVNDSGGIVASNYSYSTYRINELLALELENLSIDYGALSVTQTSDAKRKNITNIGNIPINITVRSFGGDNESIGINHTMICEAGTNITFGYQRFSLFDSTDFGSMYNITNQTQKIINLTIPKRTLNEGIGNSSNSTYWRLQVPAQASGICNGTIIFGAIDAT